MSAHQAQFPIRTMARVLKVSASGYYAWVKRPASARATRDAELTRQIRTIHAASYKTYGAPRIHAEFKESGVAIGRKRIARLMRGAGLAGISRRRRPVTTKRTPAHHPASDLVRNFTAEGPNELWVADITFIPTLAGFLFLAVVLDAWSRRIVGWSFAPDLKTCVVLDALDMALAQRKPDSVIHHSDKGSQGGFNRSTQHRHFAPPRAVGRGLPPAFSNRAFCGAAYLRREQRPRAHLPCGS
jgi:putative transposase